MQEQQNPTLLSYQKMKKTIIYITYNNNIMHIEITINKMHRPNQNQCKEKKKKKNVKVIIQ
jgi:hypothetical protein